MSRCKCGREIAPLIQTRSEQRTPVPETLRIQLNIEKPGKLVPGTEKLYCYWKISLYLDLAKNSVHLYVPPEWRLIEQYRLAEWVCQLRDNPFEDIVLGQTSYEWVNDVLMPKGQNYFMVPIPGFRGWPKIDEPVPHWDIPRGIQATGKYLPIAINRRFASTFLGMERLICYWRTKIQTPSGEERYVWVPPEWRRLPQRLRANWKRRLGAKPDQEIQLGGVTYIWYQNTLTPIGQKPELIEYLGHGKYRNAKIDESEDNEEAPCEAMDLCTKFTPEDLEVSSYTLQRLMDTFPSNLPEGLPVQTYEEILATLKALEPPEKLSRKETAV